MFNLTGDMYVFAKSVSSETGFRFITEEEDVFYQFSMNESEKKRFQLILRVFTFLCYQTDETIHISEKDLKDIDDETHEKLVNNLEQFLLQNKKTNMYICLQSIKYKNYMRKEHLFYRKELIDEIDSKENINPFFIESKILKGYRFHFFYNAEEKRFYNFVIQSKIKHEFEAINLYEKNLDFISELTDGQVFDIVKILSQEFIKNIKEFVKEDKVLRLKFLFL